MDCPYCGKEMELGVIENRNEINWKSKRHLFGNAQFHEGSVVLSERSMWSGSAVAAWLCRGCEKVVIDFKDGGGDYNRR